ncbi:MAG: hypothetical protein NC092_08290 [Butyrivibrio sp.]|nr:hypothetical protein [Muribaculum sp.]MCM1552675.1 hypothetical protein [Butyrivibrio sp.]
MIKTGLKALGKIVVSGILAFIFLTLFCFFYYNIPAHIANRDGSTDYKWEANTFYSRGTEGFAWGKTNNDGFTNMFDYDDDMKIDVLIMGSSHMEAYQVDMSQSTASRLNAMLKNETVYNIGVASHTFLICESNLRAALDKYHPTKYVVIDTSSISFSDEALTRAINGETANLPSYDGGIVYLLQKNPFLRRIYSQIKVYSNLQAKNAEASDDTEASEDIVVTEDNKKLLAKVLQKISSLAEEYDTKVIIVYHPRAKIAYNGDMSFNVKENAVAQFKNSCDENGIIFLDMSNRFKEEYESSYTLSHGFSNTAIAKGHLNQYGHAMIADELYHLISEEEQ